MNKPKYEIGSRDRLIKLLTDFYAGINQLKMTEDTEEDWEFLRFELDATLSKVESKLRYLQANKYIDE